jgi:hypothetical protein
MRWSLHGTRSAFHALACRRRLRLIGRRCRAPGKPRGLCLRWSGSKVRAGLVGGKSVPETVRHRPRLFLTLTAPSFGTVQRAGELCHPRRDRATCEHGRSGGCGAVHAPGDPVLGQPICPDCYDCIGHVLWHAHAAKLWDRFVIDVRRRLASSMGLVQSHFVSCAVPGQYVPTPVGFMSVLLTARPWGS